MLNKEKLLHAINQLPGEFSVDPAIDELILLEKIDRGLTLKVPTELWKFEHQERL